MFTNSSGMISASINASSAASLSKISFGSSKSTAVSCLFLLSNPLLERDPAVGVSTADATVDRQQLAIHVGGVVAAENRRGGRNLFRAPGTLHWRDMTQL